MDIAFARFDYEGRCEPFANFKDLQNDITDKWHDVNDSQKSYIAVEKALAAVAKQNGGPVQHIFC